METSNSNGPNSINAFPSAIPSDSLPLNVDVSTSTLRKGLGPNKAGTRDGFLAYTLQDATIFIFQLVALTVALVFAAWVIKSYDAALRANNLSNQSDQAALKGNDLSDRSLQMALSSNQAADHQASFQSQRVSLQNQGFYYETKLCGAILAALPVASIASVLSIPSVLSIDVPLPSTVSAVNMELPITAIAGTTGLSITSHVGASMTVTPNYTSSLGFSTLTSSPDASHISNSHLSTTAEIPTTVNTHIASEISSRNVTTSLTLAAPPPTDTSSSNAVVPASKGASLPPLGLGPIIGIIVGVVTFTGAVLGLVMLRLRKRRCALYDD